MSPEEGEVILLSMKVATVAVILQLPLALMIASWLVRAKGAVRVILDAVVQVPLVVPPVVTGYFLLVILGRRTVIGGAFASLGLSLSFSWLGAAIAAMIVSLPLSVRAFRLALQSVDPRMLSLAEAMGAPRWDRFIRITVPAALPGLLIGVTLAFARSLGEFGATITFVGNTPGETRTIPLAIYSALQRVGGEGVALRLSIFSVVIALVALIVAEYLLPRRAIR